MIHISLLIDFSQNFTNWIIMLVNGVFVMVPAVSFCNMRHSQKKERLHAIKDDVHKEKMCTLEEKMQELELLLMVR